MYYPNKAPTDQTLRRLLRTHRRVRIDTHSASIQVIQDSVVVLSLPTSYRVHIQRFVWRERAIRLVLDHAEELELADDLEVNLSMIMLYMDNVFRRIATESTSAFVQEPTYRSTTFDSYLLTEYHIRRHEPMYVREWRRDNDDVLELASVDECGA